MLNDAGNGKRREQGAFPLNHRDARRLTLEALHRPPLIWSPLADGVAKCFTPYVVPKDPERPFGIARQLRCGRWAEETGYEEELTRRGWFLDAAAGLIRDYRISHYWRPDRNPNAANCLLCAAPNPNHPEYDHRRDDIQCPVIRQHTMDAPDPWAKNGMLRLMFRLINQDVNDLMASHNVNWEI